MTIAPMAVAFTMVVWIVLISAIVATVLALWRWSHAASEQAKAFTRIAAAMERKAAPQASINPRSRTG